MKEFVFWNFILLNSGSVSFSNLRETGILKVEGIMIAYIRNELFDLVTQKL